MTSDAFSFYSDFADAAKRAHPQLDDPSLPFRQSIGELAHLISHLDAIRKPDDHVILESTLGWNEKITAGDLRRILRLAKAGYALQNEPVLFTGILEERIRQDQKWGGPAHDDLHTVKFWFTRIVERTPYGTRLEKARQAFVEIGALAVAAIQSIDRQAKARPQEQREQEHEDHNHK